MQNQRVSVAVRVRPVLREGASYHAQEKFELEGVRRIGDDSIKVELSNPGEPSKSHTFTFDHIFDQESTQLEVYEDCVSDLVDAALGGVNSTVLAYGQTGSGKTFTVLGDVKPNPLEDDLLTHDSGLFLRILSDLMEYKKRRAQNGWHVVVGLSCVEIYNEKIRDLFGGKPGSPPPDLKTVMTNDDVLLPSLIIKEVTSIQGVFAEIQLAIARRMSRATDSNSSSSRSHCLFSIDILQQANTAPPPTIDILEMKKNVSERSGAKRSSNTSVSANSKSVSKPDPGKSELPFEGTIFQVPGRQEPVYASKILLADLAGSEKIARSGVSGDGLTEAMSINSSLTALGNVVHSLYEGSYVSYRTSNLTRLLKPTFGHPNSRVLLLAQISPTQLTFSETVSTLHFANKVKAMKVTSSTGAEADKLLFDYIEAGRVCDSILADLRIFSVEQFASLGVIRRVNPSSDKHLFYETSDAKGGKSGKPGTKERMKYLEQIGAEAAARLDRDMILKKQRVEDATRSEREKAMLEKETAKEVSEFVAKLTEAQAGLKETEKAKIHHYFQLLQIDSSARRQALEAEEAVAFLNLKTSFMERYIGMCKKWIPSRNALYDTINQELGQLTLSSKLEDDPQEVQYNLLYSSDMWIHCIAKRFFAKILEIRDLQTYYLRSYWGNHNLELWTTKNKDSIKTK